MLDVRPTQSKSIRMIDFHWVDEIAEHFLHDSDPIGFSVTKERSKAYSIVALHIQYVLECKCTPAVAEWGQICGWAIHRRAQSNGLQGPD